MGKRLPPPGPPGTPAISVKVRTIKVVEFYETVLAEHGFPNHEQERLFRSVEVSNQSTHCSGCQEAHLVNKQWYLRYLRDNGYQGNDFF